MDPTNTFFGRTLLEEITPVVMVLRTPLVEEACEKNGLDFVQMLRPFCLFKNIDVPVRTSSDQPYRLQMFKMRLAYASEIRQQNVGVLDECLKDVVSNANEEALVDLQSDTQQLETVTRDKTKILPSWFQVFNNELLHTVSFSDHEAFDHPVACLLVVSSKDEKPINKFVDLFNTNQLPSLLNEGLMDPKILKYYLLVHDAQDGTPEKANGILADMRTTFGPNDCRLLCINSGHGVTREQIDNPWIHYKINASLGHDLDWFLNADDVNEIKDLMQNLSSKHVIPFMEQKLRSLNQQVSATRRGLRNQIKNLWWRKGKEDGMDSSSTSMYTFSSTESQIRVLGDYAFMLRDYELALSSYRLLSTDYKLDKAWKRYAGVQEMSGLCYFMLDQSRKEAEYCMESAFHTYLKIGPSGQRNATRCGLWWAEMLKAWDQHKEAAGVYFRISHEEPHLHAAVMLEQSAYCFLCSNPPMLRKYGFHLVLAGNLYDASDQRKHAIRTYKNALSVYKENVWNYINDHVHFNIGRWHAFLGIYDVAIKHMMEILSCSHQSPATQELFLREFVQTVQNTGRTYEVFKLQLPIVYMPSLRIIFEDYRVYASPAAVHVKESLWQSLEEDMVPSISTIRTNWLDSQPKSSSLKKQSDFCVSVAGEAIRVQLEFKNPLQTSISVSDVSLFCELSVRSKASGSELGDQPLKEVDGHGSTAQLTDSLQLQNAISNQDMNADQSSLILSKADFALKGGETVVVQLTVTPKVEGLLKIIGVRWTLFGHVVGYLNFESDMPKKKIQKGRRNAKFSPRYNLKFIVIKSVPKLQGHMHYLPRKVYMGDLRRLILELRNPSDFSVKNLKMKISHPRFLILGSLKDMDTEFPVCLGKQQNHEQSDVPNNDIEKPEGSLFLFPKGTVIQGGTSFQWPLWLHAGVSGGISLHLSVYYEIDNVSSEMSYRTLRMIYNLEVLPSLDVSFHITPCPSKLQEFLVRMDVVNKTNSKSIDFHQLSAIGNHWKISSLASHVSVCPSQFLQAGQALSCFFKLQDCRKSTADSRIATNRVNKGNDVLLGSQGKIESILDMSYSPLVDFHHQERLHQEKAIQECANTVDFILISQPQDGKDEPEPKSPSDTPCLLSHHACLCSVAGTSPIWWLMDGPRIVYHDFSTSFCETRFYITIHNSSDTVASIKINTFEDLSDMGHQTDTTQLEDQGGWHDLSLSNDTKVSPADAYQAQSTKPSSSQGISPFIWCESTSTKVVLEPMSTARLPLQICTFSPGTYDISSYTLHWETQPLVGEGPDLRDPVRQTSGMCPGHPFYITVIQGP